MVKPENNKLNIFTYETNIKCLKYINQHYCRDKIMKYIKILSFLLILLYIAAVTGCQKEGDKQVSYDQNQKSVTTDLETAPPSSTTTGDNKPEMMKMGVTDQTTKQVNYQHQDETYNTQDKRMIIRSGTMSIEADNFNDTELKVKQIVNGVNGYVTNSTSQLNASGKKQGSITIRVASVKFDELISQLAGIGKVMNQNISGKDVTEEFMDAEARLKTQRELEARLLKLLGEKTSTLSAIVEVEQKLAAVRENIEKTEGRMRYLKDQAAYSTLTVSVYEPAMLTTSSGGGFFYELGESISRGLTGFTKVLSGIITFIIALSPVVALVLLILYFVRRHFKKRKAAQAVLSVSEGSH